MSYPAIVSIDEGEDRYITCTVPSYQIISKINHDMINSSRLYVQALAKTLSKRIKEFAFSFREYDIVSFSMQGRFELRIRLLSPLSRRTVIERKPTFFFNLDNDRDITYIGQSCLSTTFEEGDRNTVYVRQPRLTTIVEDKGDF